MHRGLNSAPGQEAAAPPLVSIGMPVYNGGALLGPAIESLLAQTHTHFELIISDNASTDDTGAICQAWATRDPRIVYHRNPENIGATGNFERLVTLARGDYFMWAAHDDAWLPEFVAANLEALQRHPRAVGSMSQAVLEEGSGLSPIPGFNPMGTYPLDSSSVTTNLLKYLFLPGLNARFYGLWRRNVLLKTLPIGDFCSADIAFVARTLVHGPMLEVKRPLWLRGGKGYSSDSLRLLRWGERSIIDIFVPLYRFTRDLLRVRQIRQSPTVMAALCTLNLYYCVWKYKAFAVHYWRKWRSRA